MKAVLAPGGLLIVHDIRQTDGAFDRTLDGPRVAVKTLWRLARVSRVRAFLRQRAAWTQHARGDVVSTAEEITLMRNRHFPGAVIRHHFLWRYTLLWTNRGRSLNTVRLRAVRVCWTGRSLFSRVGSGACAVQSRAAAHRKQLNEWPRFCIALLAL